MLTIKENGGSHIIVYGIIHEYHEGQQGILRAQAFLLFMGQHSLSLDLHPLPHLTREQNLPPTIPLIVLTILSTIMMIVACLAA